MSAPVPHIHPDFPAYDLYAGGQVFNRKTGRQLTPVARRYGYQQITLIDAQGARKCVYVARLIAQAFHPNPLGLPDVSYRDNNPAHTAAANLYWSTGATTQRERPRAHKRNKTGIVGVSYVPARNHWQSYIVREGRRQYLGVFATAEEAGQAYQDAKNKFTKA